MARKYNSIREVPEHIKEKLSQYVTNVGRDTFVIRGLPSELTGALLARYSRAPTGLQLTLVNEFLDENGDPCQEKGTAMMDRVLNAFGDDSVGELEGTHVGIENISQLATKGIEDRRIGGSPIEQSTRYVKYDVKDYDYDKPDDKGKWRYLRPKEITEIGLKDKFEKVNDMAFEVYSEGIKRLIEHFKKEFPRTRQTIDVIRKGEVMKASEDQLETDEEKKQFNNSYNFTVRCAALDVGRCVLPSSTLTHIGLFGNGRFYTNVISYLKSSDLEEERERGNDLERELNKVIPTFIKRNKANPKTSDRDKKMRELAQNLFQKIVPKDDRVTLVDDTLYINQVVASALFPYTNISLQQIIDEVNRLPHEEKLKVLDRYIGERESRRDRSGRGLEAGYPITFDLVGGFAEYRDLERHRMLTQQRQVLTTDLGFIMPPEINIIGLEKKAQEVVGMMEELNGEIKKHGLTTQSQYATLFNHRLRFMLGMNLREFQHLSELRTQQAGHFSYRSMCMEMARELEKKHPWTPKAYSFVDYTDPGNKISRAREQSKIAGKNLAKGIEGSQDY